MKHASFTSVGGAKVGGMDNLMIKRMNKN